MAKLELMPDPQVMGIQAAIFFANMLVVKKLILDPFLQLRERRLALTTQRQADAEKMVRSCEDLKVKIDDKVKQAIAEVRAAQSSQAKAAQDRSQVMLNSAREEAKEKLGVVRSQIEKSLAEERQKLSGEVEKLAKQMLEQILTTQHQMATN